MINRRIVGPVNILLDALLVAAALLAALALRFDGRIPDMYLGHYFLAMPWVAAASVIALGVAGVHRIIWRYVGLPALLDIVKALTVSSILLGVVSLVYPVQLFPRSVLFIFWLLQILFVGGIRLVGRMNPLVARRRLSVPSSRENVPARHRALIFGAGDVGETLVRDLMRGGRADFDPVGFVDDDRSKQGRTIHGVRVLGATLDIPKLVRSRRVDMVIIAAPSAAAALVSSIFRCCQDENIECKTVPSLASYAVGKSPLQQVREVRIEDLLGREPVEIDLEEVRGFLAGRRVLVTGAGGSIGSELCRQIVRFDPEHLIALDHDENKLCYVGLELRGGNSEIPVTIVVQDVKDRSGIRRVLDVYKPTVIFHAAAHKHVSFMEDNPRSAVLNNVFGTLTVAEEAISHRVDNFVLVSTDKAVNPTNVMGATKRLCEKIITALADVSETRFNAVRFGNVLGSAGSVIPIFKRQIAQGGPVTITHPEARRYFMTIPEASQLVIQAGAFKRSGTVFVLDMGEQVKVLDVARQLIRLSGYQPDQDIDIRYIGLRPGEKLYEELLTDSERTTVSVHRKIFIWTSDPESWGVLRKQCDALFKLAEEADGAALKAELAKIVPEYRRDVPVVSLDETPELDRAAPTRALEDQYVLSGSRAREAEPAALSALRTTGRILFSFPALLAVGALALVHAFVAPTAPIFTREERIGRNRRLRPRRIFEGDVSINRRGRDRRGRNFYGQPFQRWRFNVSPSPDAGTLERRYCAFLRRHGLDALPSALHLLTGEMAVVGPSPEPVDNASDLTGPRAESRRRFSVRPGITGLTQVLGTNGHATRTRDHRFEIDKFYVEHRSIGLDLRILTRSLHVVLVGSKNEPLRLRDRLGASAAMTARLKTVGDKPS